MAAQYGNAVEAPLRLVPSLVHSRSLESLDDARDHVVTNALSPATVGTVGLELEMHLVDLDVPAARISWDRLTGTIAGLARMPCGSAVTVEPGGQVELSTVPEPDVTTAVAALDADRRALAAAFAAERLGLVAIGADPARPVERLSPNGRYAGMEEHFRATGSADAGRAMMCSTAAIQLNVNSGPAEDWSTRVSRMHRLGPVLVAISACSPWLAGRSSGWRSMRQQMWGEIDQARCGPLLDGAHPEREWASYALMAPVMLVRDRVSGEVRAVTERVPFAAWVGDHAVFGRPATIDDLDYHLSTLFPPVRPRGFLEVRCLDAVPQRWWPGLIGIAATLLDDPIAAETAEEICKPVTYAWTAAARDGLADPVIAAAARECVAIAVDRAPVLLKSQMSAYAELVFAGRTPGDDIAERAATDGPMAVLESLATEARDGA